VFFDMFNLFAFTGVGLTLTFTVVDRAGGVLAQQTLTGANGAWTPVTLPFSGVAKSIMFEGDELHFAYFTNITYYVPVPKEECPGTSYWIWNPNTERAVGELTNNTEVCLPQPYNLKPGPALLKNNEREDKTEQSQREKSTYCWCGD
jgi:hypothetical protein